MNRWMSLPWRSTVVTSALAAYWEVKGIPTRIWSRDADASVMTTVPPQGTIVDFVFDRTLDGARIEDTVDGSSASKANRFV